MYNVKTHNVRVLLEANAGTRVSVASVTHPTGRRVLLGDHIIAEIDVEGLVQGVASMSQGQFFDIVRVIDNPAAPCGWAKVLRIEHRCRACNGLLKAASSKRRGVHKGCLS